jgi:dTDP-4-dehydrorhamnose reductase
MKILLLGKYGQLGWELHRSLQCLGQVLAYDYPDIDYSKPRSLKPLIEELRPQLVINAAAFTDVDKAESEAERARLVNTEAPALLAEACRTLGSGFIHYSTDYVFDGMKGAPYGENDAPCPLNHYGQSKLEGERAIEQVGGIYLIFRTAWLYSMRRDNFVTRVLSWAHSQNELHIVEDQASNPTWARALAEVTAHLLARAKSDPCSWLKARSGLYHLAGSGFASRLEWAKAIVRNDPRIEQQLVRTILPARTVDYPSPAMRPHHSALDCSRFERAFDLRLPDWELALRLALDENE